MANVVAIGEFDSHMFSNGRWSYNALNHGVTVMRCEFEPDVATNIRGLCHGAWSGLQPFNNAMVVPGAGLEPATFGCLRHHKGLCTSYDRLGGCPMSPTRYQLRHPGLTIREG